MHLTKNTAKAIFLNSNIFTLSKSIATRLISSQGETIRRSGCKLMYWPLLRK